MLGDGTWFALSLSYNAGIFTLKIKPLVFKPKQTARWLLVKQEKKRTCHFTKKKARFFKRSI